ncbi:TIGR03032 family protein [Vacuolonema iberomarrocanum]|uniref:TIGR03032 family protein n=1 Tax=Vacuolonema iberomarrocanum TaxID=3454632 RepID=UPI003F6DA7D1
MDNAHTTETSSIPMPIQCRASDGFQHWLSQQGGVVAITTYQSGKLALIGWNGQQMTLLLRTFQKPMGIGVQGRRLALATQHQVWQFANAPELATHYLEQQPGRYDALYLPRVAHFTGDLNVHEVGYVGEEVWIVNTRFSCLSSLSSDFSFVPRWQPPFISELAPEDRCHLNGMAIAPNRSNPNSPSPEAPIFVTALGETDTVGGWRAHKATGGIVIDVANNTVISRGLAMPHSPRWTGTELLVLNSGAGELCRIDPTTGDHAVICFLPGFLRGLSCVGRTAIVGLSQVREQHIFGGLPLQARFSNLICGIALVNIDTGEWFGTFEFTSQCQELGDVAFIPHVTRPNILNTDKSAIQEAFTAPDVAYWLRPSHQLPEPNALMSSSASSFPALTTD